MHSAWAQALRWNFGLTRTGTITSVTINVSGELIEDDEATMRRLMAQQ